MSWVGSCQDSYPYVSESFTKGIKRGAEGGLETLREYVARIRGRALFRLGQELLHHSTLVTIVTRLFSGASMRFVSSGSLEPLPTACRRSALRA